MKEISIIGVTSPLGTKLTDRLADLGFGVTATFRSEDRIPKEWYHNDSIDCFPLELSEGCDLTPLCSPQVVWLAHLDQGRFNDRETTINLEPFESFLARAEDSSVRQITFISSGGAVYGESITSPIDESHPRDPLSSYGKAKKAIEDTLIAFGRSTGIHTAIIRPGNIYGFERHKKPAKESSEHFSIRFRSESRLHCSEEARPSVILYMSMMFAVRSFVRCKMNGKKRSGMSEREGPLGFWTSSI